ncbi:ATP-binding protein [Candidatus Marsarchaeota archaeon]|nr:ATP-binding protein [Candidatus Marsarchaeota archaeon]
MIDRIKTQFGKIRGFVSGLFFRRKEEGITIGKARAILKDRKIVRIRSNGRQSSVETYPCAAWRRFRKTLTIFPSKEPNPHIVVVGMSGFGKSTLFKSMLIDIKRMGKAAIIFDAHNEHEKAVRALGGSTFDASRTAINILELDGISKQQRIYDIVGLFKKVYGLGQIQATKLSQCLSYTYRKADIKGTEKKAPTIRELINEINIFISNSRSSSEKTSLMHLKEKMYPLMENGARHPIEIGRLKDGISSFSLAGLKSKEARIIYIHELLRRLYSEMKANPTEKGLRLFIMVDEAQFLLNSQGDSPIVTSMVEEGRKYGVGVVIATHISSNLDRQILANASTLISFYPRDPQEINYIANAMSGGMPILAAAIKGRLRMLKQNQAIVVSGRTKAPVAVDIVRASGLAKKIEQMEVSKSEGPPPVLEINEPMEYGEAAAKAGSDSLDREIASGSIEKERVAIGKEEKEFVMSRGNKSTEHEVCTGTISKRLSNLGIRHYVLGNLMGPDIIAYIGNEKVAIEYETGRKSYRSTAKMLESRKRKFSKTIVFVNSKAYQFYSSYYTNNEIEVIDIKALENWPNAPCHSI